MSRYMTAPWREEYVRKGVGAGNGARACVFCRAAGAADDAKVHVLFRGAHNFVILNRYPYTTGHLMIAPYRHISDFTKATVEETAEMTALFQAALRVLGRHYKPHGFNAGMNLGQSAGAGVAGHFHLHVIPRWTGDSNFMPIVGRTRVFIEDLDTTYERLRPLFNERKSPETRSGGKKRAAGQNRGTKC